MIAASTDRLVGIGIVANPKKWKNMRMLQALPDPNLSIQVLQVVNDPLTVSEYALTLVTSVTQSRRYFTATLS